MKTLPTFLVIGVAKAGTTALYHHLKAHPEVFMPAVKEPEFFSYEGTRRGLSFKPDDKITHLEEYYALYDNVRDEKAVGEASPRYFHSLVAPGRIKETIPEARLIVLLRHPVDRAYSHCMDMMNSGAFPYQPFVPLFREKARAVEAWAQEPFNCYGFLHSFYHDSLQRYYALFPRDRILVLLFEDYVTEPRSVLRDVYAFLGVDTSFVPDLDTRHNPTFGIPRSTMLHKTVMRPNRVKTLTQKLIPTKARKKILGGILKSVRTKKPDLSPAIRAEFVEVYREDILKVQTLTGRDLSSWLSSPQEAAS